MTIHHLHLGELKSNCYIVETAPERCIAVDIGGDSSMLLNFLIMKKLKLTKILLTHGHYDHINGVAEVVAKTGAEVYIHADDAYMLENASASLASSMSIMRFNPVHNYTAVFGDCYINDGNLTFHVLHTPGHSPGSVCYICEDVIFSGDTLFCCSIGRTDLPGGNINEMRSSLRKLCSLEGEYRVYPGHNDSTTLGYERECNPYLLKL
ncbi:MAG: MBL fold metallo-hydrolase [Ruminococcus sp.]|nr:MBL fold metallo-hydrolase [Ruminococcus sp.]